MENILGLSELSEEDYQKTIVQKMGYDPMKEMRINKLERMCGILTSTNRHRDDANFGRLIKEKDIKFLFDNIKNIKPLLFKMTKEMQNVSVDKEAFGDLPIDIPFQTFSIEPADDWHGLYTCKDKMGMLNATLIVIHEIKPDYLRLYTLYNFIPHNNETPPHDFVEMSGLVFLGNGLPSGMESLYAPLSMYLEKLDNRTAQVEYKTRVKMRVGKKKYIIKSKTNAIYVDPSRKYTDKTFGSREIEWTHSWEVAGHWRRFDGIGKSRNGERNVEDWTWVKPHKKGDGELVTKKRIIK